MDTKANTCCRLFTSLSPLLILLAAHPCFGRSDQSSCLTNRYGNVWISSANHVVDFNRNGISVAGSNHVLRVEFVGAHSVGPIAGSESSATVKYCDLWDGVTLSYDAP